MGRTYNITRNILNKYEIKASKRFGQNFLINDNVLEEIVEVSNITNKDLVIEIGPGLGNLTEYLLQSAKHVLLVEIDDKMIQILNDRFEKQDNYTLINDDILKIDIDEKISKIEKDLNIEFENIKVVANLPYYITTPIIFKLLEQSKKISEIVVMVQKEVAERMVAKYKTKDYGILTIMVDYMSDASIEIVVPRDSFIPAPNVTSAVIKLVKNKKYSVCDEDLLYELVHMSFAKRRKKIINSLELSDFLNLSKKTIEQIILQCGCSQNTRAEELKIEDYIKITEYINENIVEKGVDK